MVSKKKTYQLYIHPKCTTCKKAIAFLNKQHVTYEIFDIRENTPSRSQLKRMLSFQEGSWRKMMNSSGQDYRALGLAKKIGTMADADIVELLASNGMLIKRPFLLTEEFGLLGFKESQWESQLLKKP
jgi:arsenate reductase